MNRWGLLLIFVLAAPMLARASGEGAAPTPSPTTSGDQEQDQDQNNANDESEDKGIIPSSANIYRSSQPVTPVTNFPVEKVGYDQAKDELAQAEALWARGEAEAASDTALEAYDDLVAVHRRNKKERKKLFAERHRAAAVYVKAGIKFIQEFINRNGRSPQVVEEGRSRLEDLRDVARNYEDLNHELNKALDQLITPK